MIDTCEVLKTLTSIPKLLPDYQYERRKEEERQGSFRFRSEQFQLHLCRSTGKARPETESETVWKILDLKPRLCVNLFSYKLLRDHYVWSSHIS